MDRILQQAKRSFSKFSLAALSLNIVGTALIGLTPVTASAATFPKPTAISVATSGTPSTVGDSVTFTATLTKSYGLAALLGTVTFKDGATTLGTKIVPIAGGFTNSKTITLTTSALTVGSHSITASFDSTFGSILADSNSSAITQVVNYQETDETIVVTPMAPNGWTVTDVGVATHAFQFGPATPPIGDGSLKFSIPNSDDYTVARNSDYAGVKLSDISELSYDTYITSYSNGQAPYLSFKVDNNNDGNYDDVLYFEPTYQSGIYSGDVVPNQCVGHEATCAILNTWQHWDALNGGWWTESDGAGGPPLHTLAGYIAAHPTSTIVNDGALGGVRVIGGAGVAMTGNFDKLIIKQKGERKTFDFDPVPASPCSVSGTGSSFDAFTNGSVNGQDGWTETNASYDQAIVPNNYGYSTFGCKSLRVSDGVTSGAFDWIFMPPMTDSVGETAATAGAFSVGTKKDHYEVQFDIASTMATEQPGLHVSVSPDRGDGSRMSYLRFEDQADGVHVFFDDYNTTDQFNETEIATIDRTPHTIKMTFDAVDGASNDIVNVYIDGVLKHTGTSWEDYYRFDPEASAEQSPRIIKTMIIQARGTANPANMGNGFLFDNFNLTSDNTVQPMAACVPTDANLGTYLSFDEVHTPAIDHSGNGVNGTYMNDVEVSNDVPTLTGIGNNYHSLHFNGSSYVTLGDNLDMGTGDYSVSTWFKTMDSNYSLFSKSFYGNQNARFFLVDEGIGLYAGFQGTSVVETAPVTAFNNGQWHNAVVTFDRDGMMKLYVDGTLQSSADISAQAGYSLDSASPFFLGRYNDGIDGQNPHASQLALDGNMDEFRVYNRALTASEIAGLFAGSCDVTPQYPSINFLGIRNQSSGTYDDSQAIQACGMTNSSGYIAFEWADTNAMDPSVSYKYEIISGPAAGFSTDVTTTHVNGGIPAEGAYVVQVTPKDADGHTGTPQTCAVTYDADYVPPSSASSMSSASSESSEGPVACTIEDSRLIGHWTLDESAEATIANDSTSGNHDGTVNGAASGQTGATPITFANAGSYDFDGTDDSIDLGTNVGNFTLADHFSISAWINPALDSENHAIYGNTWDQPGYLLRVTAENKVRFILVENGGVYNGMDSTVLTPGWHHVVGSWDGTSVKVFVDGVDSSATPITNGTVTTITTSAHTFIGQTGEATVEQYFDGMIDDVRVYDVALSDSEVAALGGGLCEGGEPTPASSASSASSESSVASSVASSESSEESSTSSASSSSEIVACTTSGLTGYWPMNEGEGTTTFDMTGLGHDGTLQGGTAWASGAPGITPNPFGLDFDGSDDIVNVTNSTDYNYGSQDFTVSTFVKTTTGNRSILGNFSAGFKGWGLYVYNTNQVNFFGYGSMGNNDAAKPALVLDGNWHNITGVYHRSGNDLTIDTYVDGVLVGSNTATTGDISANSTLYFGQYLPQPSMDGNMDDVRIYNRALTAGEVANIAGGCSNPVVSSSASSESSVSSTPSSEGSSTSSEPTIQTFGLSTPVADDGNSSHRGSRTNILAGVIKYITNKFFGNSGTAPGAFGGGPTVPFTGEEIDIICSLKKALPVTPSVGLVNWAVAVLAGNLNRSEIQILEAMQDDSLCGSSEAKAVTKVSATPIEFHVSAAGYPVSSNATWNQCITGKVTLKDIQNNTDKDGDGRPRTCASYHTGNMWTHPDLDIFFTWNPKTKQVTLPTNYALVKDAANM